MHPLSSLKNKLSFFFDHITNHHIHLKNKVPASVRDRRSLLLIPALLLFSIALYIASHIISPTTNENYRTKLLEKMEYAQTFSDFTSALFCYEVSTDSITTAYTLKNPQIYDIPSLPATLSTFSFQKYDTDKTEKTEEKLLTLLSNQLSQYDKSTLSQQEQLTYTLLSNYFWLNKQLAPYAYYEELLGATTGIQANLPVTLSEYPLRTEQDVKTYLSLLSQIPSYFDNIILYEKKRQELGYSTPDFMRKDTLDGLTTLVDSLQKEDNCFVETFKERIQTINTLSTEQINDYCKKNQKAVIRYVLPAYQKLQKYVNGECDDTTRQSNNSVQQTAAAKNQQQIFTGQITASNEQPILQADTSKTQPQNTEQADTTNESSQNSNLTESSSRNRGYIPEPNTAYGLATLPDGTNYYTYLVKSNTGSSHSPRELISMTETALKSALSNVRNIALTDPKSYLYYCDNPAASYYENPEAILEALSLLIREDYPSLPANPSYTVKSVPDSLASHLSPAFYMIPAFDDYKDNTIYINQLYTNTENGNLFTTLAHEGFPGHLYQTVYFNSQNPPAIRHILDYPGFVEGWATYVELNSFHYMNYPLKGNSLCTLYQSDTIISLALSSRVDLGVNYEGWTLNNVNKFFEDSGFSSYYAADVYAYVVEAPATYLRYFVGYLEIEQLKKDYKNQEMEHYSEKDFHKKLLEIGPADFDTIREYILK